MCCRKRNEAGVSVTCRKNGIHSVPAIGEVPLLDKTVEAVVRLRNVKAAGVYNISVELLRAGGAAMMCGLYAIFTAR